MDGEVEAVELRYRAVPARLYIDMEQSTGLSLEGRRMKIRGSVDKEHSRYSGCLNVCYRDTASLCENVAYQKLFLDTSIGFYMWYERGTTSL